MRPVDFSVPENFMDTVYNHVTVNFKETVTKVLCSIKKAYSQLSEEITEMPLSNTEWQAQVIFIIGNHSS